jgi:MSHA biogenesis protein MshL
MKKLMLCALAAGLAGCNAPPRQAGVDPQILAAVEAGTPRQPRPSAAVNEALLPPLRMEMPDLSGRPLDGRFDLAVSNAPAAQVFMSLASGTRYSMLVHPNVSGSISMNLKDVTLREALDAIRQLYGYDYRVDGTRIFVQPAGLQTRIFQVNYLPGQRRGFSDVRVQSGAVTDAGAASPQIPGSPAVTGAAPVSRSLESSRVTTQQSSDFWADLRAALLALVGGGEGRSVVVTAHSGVVVVRALPGELRAVEEYLRATRVSVERQVMLEAKIVEVTLSKAYQAGINWAGFRNTGPNVTVGQLGPNTARRAPAATVHAGPRGGLGGAHGGERRDQHRRGVRPRAADLELRPPALLPRVAGQRAGALQPAHRHHQQQQGGAQGRHR